MDIKIPNLGDGIDSAIVISILVKQGDTVTADQTLIELETDKAVAPVPSPAAGTITSLTIKEGDTVSNGTLIGQLDSGGNAEVKQSITEEVVQSVNVSAPKQVQPVAVSAQAPTINSAVSTSISIQKLAYRIGLDLRYISGTGNSGRITETDVSNHINYLQSLMLNPSTESETKPKNKTKQNEKQDRKSVV